MSLKRIGIPTGLFYFFEFLSGAFLLQNQYQDDPILGPQVSVFLIVRLSDGQTRRGDRLFNDEIRVCGLKLFIANGNCKTQIIKKKIIISRRLPSTEQPAKECNRFYIGKLISSALAVSSEH